MATRLDATADPDRRNGLASISGRRRGRPFASGPAIGRAVTCLALVLILGLVGFGCNQAQPPPQQLAAAEILQRSGEAMSKVRSLHFQFQVVNGTMSIGPNLVATTVEGDVAAPDRLQMTVKARLANTPVELQIAAIGPKQYLTNPLTRQWQDVSGSLVVPALLDPERGLGAVLRRVANPERLGLERVDDVSAYHLRGKVPADALATFVGGAAAAAEPVAVELWVDEAGFRLRQVKLVGAIVASESAFLERVLKMTDFDKPVTIGAPIQ